MIPAHGEPLGRALLRSEAADFQVDELLPFEPSGEGEHCLVRVRKRGWNTEAVARELARRAGVSRGAVGLAGLKDRYAVATQWLSVHSPRAMPALEPGVLDEGLEILTAVRNGRKLRRGALRENRFHIRLRSVRAPSRAVDRRLAAIAARGVPNYFGRQRFGRHGDNVEQARGWLLRGEAVRGRGTRGLLLSAVRSALFNRVLARRVAEGTWDRLEPGDRAVLDGRGSHFSVPALDGDLRRRAAAGSLHPTGPLPGSGGDGPSGRVAELEAEVLAEEPDLVAALERQGIEAARRALRVMPRQLAWSWPDADGLALSFALPPGAYATTVIGEVVVAEEPAAEGPEAAP